VTYTITAAVSPLILARALYALVSAIELRVVIVTPLINTILLFGTTLNGLCNFTIFFILTQLARKPSSSHPVTWAIMLDSSGATYNTIAPLAHDEKPADSLIVYPPHRPRGLLDAERIEPYNLLSQQSLPHADIAHAAPPKYQA
jgi:hypothetical protein